MKTLLAVDPGASGGIAWTHGGSHIDAVAMPETEADVVELLKEIQERARINGDEIEAVVEKVNGFIGKAQPGSAMFKFGFGCGVIEGALRALNIRTIYVRPQEWQKKFNLGKIGSIKKPKLPKGATPDQKAAHKDECRRVNRENARLKTEWKNKLKAEAQRRFPQLKVTLKTADALLVLEAGK